MKNFVSAQWVIENRDKVVLIDARFDMHAPDFGREEYAKGHIEGAFFLDLNLDLAGVKNTDGTGGGRPLPRLEDFRDKIANMGITEDKVVVVYDSNMLSGSRGVLVFKYFGVQNVKLVDGGLKSLIEAGAKVTADKSTNSPSTITLSEDMEMTRDYSYINTILNSETTILVENRGLNRYLGIEEPIYPVKGHIPGAKCIPSESILNKNGRVVGIDELKRIFNRLESNKEIIFYCGSGVNAALVYLAYDELGKEAKIYIGGFSEWISNPNNKIETKDEN